MNPGINYEGDLDAPTSELVPDLIRLPGWCFTWWQSDALITTKRDGLPASAPVWPNHWATPSIYSFTHPPTN